MKRIAYLFFSISLFLIQSSVNAEVRIVLEKPCFSQEQVPVEKKKSKKNLKRKKKIKKKRGLCNKLFIPSEPIVGILTWSLLITGAVLFFIGCFNGFIIWILGLMLLGFSNVMAIVTSIFFYDNYYEPAEAGPQIISNLATIGLNFIFGLTDLILGFSFSIPLLWIVGIVLFLFLGMIILIIALGL